MFNTLNTIRQYPYPQTQNNYKANNGETDKDGHNGQNRNNQQGQPQSQTVARGRAQEVQNQDEFVENRAPIYSPAANAYPQAFQTPQTYKVNTPPIIRHSSPHQMNPMQYQAAQSGYQPIQNQSTNSPIPAASQLSNKVNIAQIIKDFRNTIKAIATPPDIEEEVEHYLQIVNRQVTSPQPQVNIIQSNLKIAASILDKYISDTLHKESKVVQNWLEALFLQKINYSYNENEINPNFLVKFPEENKQQKNNPKTNEISEQAEQSQDNSLPANESENIEIKAEAQIDYFENNNEDISGIKIEPEELTLEEEFAEAQKSISKKANITITPQDTKLKSLFVEAKKQAFANNPKKAMSIFKEAFNRASELNDTETQSRICLEIGKIYDDNDHYVQALNSYNKSLEYTTDITVKSKAHYSMAQIYDDINEIVPALNHYLTSISYAGKSEDLIGQSDSLTRMANIFTDKYDQTAFDYYDVAKKLIEQTTDSNMKGFVLSNTGDACVQFRKGDKALKYYAEAVKNYEKINDSEEIAKNYKSAAEVMIGFNSPNKARSLLKKALINAVKSNNEDLIAEVNNMLISVS